MHAVVLLLLTVPLAAALFSVRAPLAAVRAVTVGCGVTCFLLVLILVPAAAHGDVEYLSFLRVDALSAVFLLATAFLYGSVAIYSVGYLRGGPDVAHTDRYSRRFWAGLNVFAWAMLAA